MSDSKIKAVKWKNNYLNSIDKTVDRVKSGNTNPVKAAIAAKERMLQNWTNSVQSGKWAKRLLKNSMLETWKSDTVQGWEKNRNIDKSVIEYMELYYENLESVTSKLKFLVQGIMDESLGIARPNSIPETVVSQNVSSALTKFQKKLLGVKPIQVIADTIKPYLIDKFGYIDNSQIIVQGNPIADRHIIGWETLPLFSKIQREEPSTDNSFITTNLADNLAETFIEMNYSDESYYGLGENNFELYIRYKSAHPFQPLRAGVFQNGFLIKNYSPMPYHAEFETEKIFPHFQLDYHPNEKLEVYLAELNYAGIPHAQVSEVYIRPKEV